MNYEDKLKSIYFAMQNAGAIRGIQVRENITKDERPVLSDFIHALRFYYNDEMGDYLDGLISVLELWDTESPYIDQQSDSTLEAIDGMLPCESDFVAPRDIDSYVDNTMLYPLD